MIVAIDKALAHQVILLSGEEEMPRRKSLEALVSALTQDGDDFDLQTFDADSSSSMDWVASASTAPFLSPRRTVIVRHLLRLDSPQEVFGTGCQMLKGVPPSGLLILVADDEQGDESRQRKLKSNRTAWENAISKAGGFVFSFKSDAKNLRSVLATEIENRGLKITPKALDGLIEMTGGSLSRALDELEKLALFATDGQIQESHVNQVVVASREWNVFKMADGIFSANIGMAMGQLRILLGSSSKPEDVAFSAIIPQLSNQLKLMWQARICHDNKIRIPDIPDNLSYLFPEKPNFLKEADWKQQRILRLVRSMPFPKIAQCLQILSDTDASLKGILPAYSAQESLEQMVLKMVTVVGGPSTTH